MYVKDNRPTKPTRRRILIKNKNRPTKPRRRRIKYKSQADQAHEKKKAVSGATKLAKESGMPKKPMAAYMLFNVEQTPGVIEEEKAKNDGKAPDMIARAAIIKKKWDALGAAGQKKYQDKYAADKAQYAIDLENWNKSEAGVK